MRLRFSCDFTSDTGLSKVLRCLRARVKSRSVMAFLVLWTHASDRSSQIRIEASNRALSFHLAHHLSLLNYTHRYNDIL